jgi:hypothetical protein
MSDRLRILMLGYLVRGPIGGMAWGSALNYLAGLAALGHDVYLVEDSGDEPWACWDPDLGMIDSEPVYGLTYAASALASLGLPSHWAYHDAPRGRWHGPLGERIVDICRTADLSIDIGGINPARSWLAEVPRRVLLDLDPVFTQVKHLTDANADSIADKYTDFLTVGCNFGKPGCTIPDDSLPWQPTISPIFLPAWPVVPAPGREARFTTVMQWESYRAVEHDGRRYGLKSASFTPYIDLPKRVGPNLELAAGGGAPVEQLRAKGWVVRDPFEASLTPDDYQAYIRGSRAEFTVAKHGYVATRSGWFSERSAAYLATGRPVVTQETAFTNWLDARLGVVAFSNPDEAAAAIEDVDSRYEQHARAAREIAEAYFDSRVVLTDLLERVFASASRA